MHLQLNTRLGQPRAASDFSALELLPDPDELLKRVVGFLGMREAWEVCRLPLVSRRMRDALASIEFDALVLRGQRGGVSRYRDVPEAESTSRAVGRRRRRVCDGRRGVPKAEFRSWAQRVRSGALRLAAGGALEIDLWHPPQYEAGSVAGADSIQPSFWVPEPARPFLAFASSLQGLRRFVGDAVAREVRSGAAGTKALVLCKWVPGLNLLRTLRTSLNAVPQDTLEGPAPAQGDLVLARRLRDDSDGGAIRPLLKLGGR
eukprot:tig00020825_g14289.t1